MKALPLFLLTSCLSTPPECEDELTKVERACASASVVGSNENKELYDAVREFKQCAGERFKLICSDDGDNNILTIKR
jgi:hypothetical protein